MIHKHSLLFYLIVITAFYGCEQFDDLTQEGDLDSWEQFNTSNGLTSDSIYCLHADSKGNMWAGTWDRGLMKYNGKQWSSYTTANGLPSNYVTSVYEYYSGDIWIGSPLGLSVYDGSKFTDYSLFDSIWITSILPDINGDIWVGTRNSGLVHLKGGSDFDQYYDENNTAKNIINSIDQSSDGTIWAGTNGGLLSINKTSTVFFTSQNGLPSDTVTAVLADQWFEIWIADYYSKNVVKIDTGGTRKLSLFNGGEITAVNSIAEDRLGNIWFGLIGDGAVKFDGVGMRTYSVSDGLPGISILDIEVDNQGAIWFGSMANGISKFTPASIYY